MIVQAAYKHKCRSTVYFTFIAVQHCPYQLLNITVKIVLDLYIVAKYSLSEISQIFWYFNIEKGE